MKRLLLLVSLLTPFMAAQTTTSITGTIKDLSQNLVTSGQVTFTLRPSADTTISGIARFSPQTITCLINSSGQIVSASSGTCTVTMNTALNPPGSYYLVKVCPYNVCSSTFTFYAVQSSYDWSTVVPTPTTSPAQNFVDIFSDQIIGGNKTFSGTTTFQGPLDGMVDTFSNQTIGGNKTFSGSTVFNGGLASTDFPGFPQKLLGFSGSYSQVVSHDSNSWDANGLGSPSNAIFINGQWWYCVSGYPTSAYFSESIGCLSGPLASPTMYSGNPVFTNSSPPWASTCIEAPDLLVQNGIVYMFFIGFSGTCDAMSAGNASIGMVSTTVANFPTGWSAMTSTPLISKPSQMNWMFRPWVSFWDNEYYLFMNGGNSSSQYIIGCFTSSSVNGPYSYQGASISVTQGWETGELQEPQVWHDPSGWWIMLYTNQPNNEIGFAVNSSLSCSGWTKLSNNPIPIAGTGNTGLSKVVRDSEGSYHLLSGTNNSAGTWYSEAVGVPMGFSPAMIAQGPPTSTNPYYLIGSDYTGKFDVFATYPGGGGALIAPVPVLSVDWEGNTIVPAAINADVYIGAYGVAPTFTSEQTNVGTPTCDTADSFQCTTASGVVVFTVASGGASAGDYLKIAWPLTNPSVYKAQCTFTPVLNFPDGHLLYQSTALFSTTGCGLNVNAALAAGTYKFNYWVHY